jgi:hypothetical protein
MNVTQQNLIIPPSGQLILEPGNFFFLLSASQPVSVQFFARKGAPENFNNLTAGLRVARLAGWLKVTMTGVVGTTVVVWHGNENAREDSTDFLQQIATISGTVLINQGAGSVNTMTDRADSAIATNTTITIPANAARKGVIIGSLSSNAPATTNLRVRGTGNVVGGQELQAGTNYFYPVAAAIDVFNGDANAQTVWSQDIV